MSKTITAGPRDTIVIREDGRLLGHLTVNRSVVFKFTPACQNVDAKAIKVRKPEDK